MSNRLLIEVTDPDGLLATQPLGLGAGAIIRVQTSATQTGTYANLTTIPIVANDHEYVYEHLAGLITDWYRVRFEDAVGSFPKAYAAPFQVNDATSAYATPAAFRTFIRSSGIDADAYTETLALDAAARAIDRACGRTFRLAGAASARVFTVGLSTATSGVYGQYRQFAADIDDLFDVTGMTVAFDVTGDGSYTLPCTTYRVQPTNAPQKGMPYTSILFNIGTLPPINGEGVQVTALWGWPAIPSAVVLANMIQASRFVKRRDSPFGIAGSPEMGNELRLLPRLDPDLVVMLAEYKLDWGTA